MNISAGHVSPSVVPILIPFVPVIALPGRVLDRTDATRTVSEIGL